MAMEWIESFDTNSGTAARYAYRYTTTGSPQNNTGRTGSAGDFAGGAATYLERVLTSKATRIVGMAIKVGSVAVQRVFFQLVDSATVQIELRINADGTVSVVQGDGTVLGTSTAVLSTSAWSYVELKSTIHGTTGSFTLKIGGTTEASGTNVDTQNSGNATADRIRFGGLGTPANQILLDDFYLADDAGGANDDFLGAVKIETLRPTGAGNTTQWTPNAGANWDRVDEAATDSDTTYNAADTVAEKDTYAFGNLSVSALSIMAVQLSIHARKDDATTRKIKGIVRHSGTDYQGDEYTLTTSYVEGRQIYETNPGTSAAWNGTDVDAAEFGVEVTE